MPLVMELCFTGMRSTVPHMCKGSARRMYKERQIIPSIGVNLPFVGLRLVE
jgi:hypothetical protein